MEEKLRNLSQNIAANTGDEHQPKHHHPEDDTPKEEEHHEEEHHDEPPMDEAEENVPEPEDNDNEESDGHIEAVEEDSSSEAKILTMDTEEEPQESPTRTKKYSPEVEAALNRLNTDDAAVDLSEPLSTEPKKKHHGAHIFLFILFVLAIAAVSLCILVEQKIIDNPFPDIFNKAESSQTAPANTNKADTKAKTDTDTKTDTETAEPTRGSANSTTNTEEKQ